MSTFDNIQPEDLIYDDDCLSFAMLAILKEEQEREEEYERQFYI